MRLVLLSAALVAGLLTLAANAPWPSPDGIEAWRGAVWRWAILSTGVLCISVCLARLRLPSKRSIRQRVTVDVYFILTVTLVLCLYLRHQKVQEWLEEPLDAYPAMGTWTLAVFGAVGGVVWTALARDGEYP